MALRGFREPSTDHLFSRHRARGYQAILPTLICGWDDKALKACVAFGAPDQQTLAPRVSRTASARGSGKKVIERIK
jgi:hypothetical protein